MPEDYPILEFDKKEDDKWKTYKVKIDSEDSYNEIMDEVRKGNFRLPSMRGTIDKPNPNVINYPDMGDN